MYIRLVQDFGMETEVAQHLAQAYGDRAYPVAKLAALTGKRWPSMYIENIKFNFSRNSAICILSYRKKNSSRVSLHRR